MNPGTRRADCILVSPPGDVPRYPYLGLCFLAAVLRREKMSVEILDCAARNFSPEQAVAWIAARDPRIVGISVMSMLLPACYAISQGLKKACAGTVIVVGGAHINAVPYAVRDMGADYGFHGESEFSFAEFCKRVLHSHGDVSPIRGLIHYDHHQNVIVNSSGIIEDLDSIPDPAYELVIDNVYYNPDTDRKVAAVITSRGCPYDCIYCSKVQKTHYRYVSSSRIVALLKRLVGEYGVRRVAFIDEIFTINKARVHELCESMIREKLDIAWGCATRADAVDDALLECMSRAGCDKISFGVETGSERIRFAGNKRIPNRVYEDAFKLCRKHKIKIMADFIFGHPGETVQDMAGTILFAIKTNPDYAFFHKMLPIPDSRLYENYKKETGRNEAWKEFMLGNAAYPVYYPPSAARKWVDLIYAIAWYCFYLSPFRIFKNLRELKNPKMLWKSLKTFLAFSSPRRYN